jgi:hypothetical protein
MKPYIETLIFQGDPDFRNLFAQDPHYFRIGDEDLGLEQDFTIVRHTFDSSTNLISCQIEIDCKEKELLLQIAIQKGLIERSRVNSQGSTPFYSN